MGCKIDKIFNASLLRGIKDARYFYDDKKDDDKNDNKMMKSVNNSDESGDIWWVVLLASPKSMTKLGWYALVAKRAVTATPCTPHSVLRLAGCSAPPRPPVSLFLILPHNHSSPGEPGSLAGL